jgi:predicted nucleic acid-binding protein
LDELIDFVEYLPLTTPAMRQAAELWAQARQKGQPTAGDNTIDADMILVAQVMMLNVTNAIIATTNVGHLSRFFPAETWRSIVA